MDWVREGIGDVIGFWEARIERYTDRVALQIKRKSTYHKISYGELGKRAKNLSSILIKLGIEKGDRLAILSESRPEWGIAFFGIIMAGGIVVPLDVKLKGNEIQKLLDHSGARCIFVSKDLLGVTKTVSSPHLKHIISLEEEKVRDEEFCLGELKPVEEKPRRLDFSDTAILVYTSGTTGNPKGVELDYNNLFSQILTFESLLPQKKENFLSILPLSHTLEITCGFLWPLSAGSCITYLGSLNPREISETMKETGITIMITVPLVLRVFYDGILKRLEAASSITRWLFRISLGVSKGTLAFGIETGRLLFRKVHLELGGRFRCFISGGTALDLEVGRSLSALGITVLQGYGLTETSPVVSTNNPKENRMGSVGKPLPGVEVRILNSKEGEREGEILVRGPNLMKGYYKDSEATTEVIRDGWLYTGDIGWIDDDGFLYISGRLKNLIVTGGGKNIYPEEVEEELVKSPYIKEICVFGKIIEKGFKRGTEQIWAAIVPDYESYPDIDRKRIRLEIDKYGANLAEYKQIKDFVLLKEEFPKTTTRKIKRKEVLELVNPVRKDGSR